VSEKQILEKTGRKNLKDKKTKLDVEKIIETGREFYKIKGDQFSMRDIANELNTGPSSLYRHVSNKRELWFAILTKDFEEFGLEMGGIAKNHKGTSTELLFKMGEFFIEFSKKDFSRFKLMFLSEPPISNKEPGIFENNCNPNTFQILVDLVKNVVEENNLKNHDPLILANTLWALVLGASLITSPINDYQFDNIFQDNKNIDKFKKSINQAIKKIIN
jgi:AcrR family transcriptional regulator